ncbi:putative toxin-antitoxin system, toxin component [Escherichia coli TA280]|nr:putative toxin-antitoxin system, toxin component [Escherichia coli TA280]
MGSKWIEVSLGEISEKIGDGIHGTPTYNNSGNYYFINGSNLIDNSIKITETTKCVDHDEYLKHRKKLSNNTVLVSINGTIGNTALYNNENIILGKSACYINLKDNISKHFILYVLSGYLFQEYIQRCSTGSTIKNVSLKMMRDFRFLMPESKEEQEKVVRIIQKIDELKRLNNAQNQTLEQMSQALFKSWFVDFDPVIDNALDAGNPIPETLQSRAELRQNVRNSTDFKPLPAEIRSLFPSEFEETELGWVPKGWESETFDSFCDLIQSGGTPSRKETSFWDGGTIKWLSSGEVKGKIILDTKEKITDIGLLNSSSKLWEKYTTVVAMYGATAGEVCIIGDKMAANQACCGLYSKIFPFFVYNFVCNKANELASKATGSAQQNLNKLIISTTKFICPSNDIITIFEDNVTPLFMKWFSNSSENNTLIALRDTLLPKLISGELSVEDLPDHIKQTEAA